MQSYAVTAIFDGQRSIIQLPAAAFSGGGFILLINGQVLTSNNYDIYNDSIVIDGNLSKDELVIVIGAPDLSDQIANIKDYLAGITNQSVVNEGIWPITPITFLPPDPAGELPAWAQTTDPIADLAANQSLDLKLSCLDYSLLDLSLNTSLDLSTDSSLDTAIVISLFTDRYDPETQQGGWWGDASPITPNLMGSRLWKLDTAKVEVQTLRDAEEYTKEALIWLLDDQLITSMTISAKWERAVGHSLPYRLRLAIAAIINPKSHYGRSYRRDFLI